MSEEQREEIRKCIRIARTGQRQAELSERSLDVDRYLVIAETLEALIDE